MWLNRFLFWWNMRRLRAVRHRLYMMESELAYLDSVREQVTHNLNEVTLRMAVERSRMRTLR
jgi:hypothetical protein